MEPSTPLSDDADRGAADPRPHRPPDAPTSARAGLARAGRELSLGGALRGRARPVLRATPPRSAPRPRCPRRDLTSRATPPARRSSRCAATTAGARLPQRLPPPRHAARRGRGCKKAFVCRYHGWTYALDGALRHVPHERRLPGPRQERARARPGGDRASARPRVRHAGRAGSPARALERSPAADPVRATGSSAPASSRCRRTGRSSSRASSRATTSARPTRETFYPVQYDNLNVVETFGRQQPHRVSLPRGRASCARCRPRSAPPTGSSPTSTTCFRTSWSRPSRAGIFMAVLEPLAIDRTRFVTYVLTDRAANDGDAQARSSAARTSSTPAPPRIGRSRARSSAASRAARTSSSSSDTSKARSVTSTARSHAALGGLAETRARTRRPDVARSRERGRAASDAAGNPHRRASRRRQTRDRLVRGGARGARGGRLRHRLGAGRSRSAPASRRALCIGISRRRRSCSSRCCATRARRELAEMNAAAATGGTSSTGSRPSSRRTPGARCAIDGSPGRSSTSRWIRWSTPSASSTGASTAATWPLCCARVSRRARSRTRTPSSARRRGRRDRGIARRAAVADRGTGERGGRHRRHAGAVLSPERGGARPRGAAQGRGRARRRALRAQARRTASATRVPSKKRGLPPANSETGFSNRKARSCAGVSRPRSTSS